jgi:hypothetical protein
MNYIRSYVFVEAKADRAVHELSLETWGEAAVQLQNPFLRAYSVNGGEHSSVGLETWGQLRHVSLQLQSNLRLINGDGDCLK